MRYGTSCRKSSLGLCLEFIGAAATAPAATSVAESCMMLAPSVLIIRPRRTRPHSNLSIELMSQQEIDDYLAKLDEPKRTTLQQLRQTIHSIVPEAEEGMSYGIPAYRLQGKVVAGFAAFKNHLSYLPHSGSVFAEIPDEVPGYVTSKGALQFPIDRTLPEPLVKKLRQAIPVGAA